MFDEVIVMKTAEHFGFKLRERKGAVAVIVALAMTVFLGIAAMAVDVGHIMVVKNELHNAADADALARANLLYAHTPSGFTSATPPTPDWAAAESAASTIDPANKSDGVTLTSYEVETGYWNLDQNPAGLQPKSITPGTRDVAAVKVTVRRVDGTNGGSIRHWFGAFVGNLTSNASATAIAICSSPGTAKPGTLVPMAIPLWIAKRASHYNSPSNLLTIGSAYHYDAYAPVNPDGDPYTNTVAGQWTSLTSDPINNANHLKDIIVNGNSNPLSIGDPLYIEPGTMDVGYHDNYMGLYEGQTVFLPVVDAVLRDAVKQNPAPPIEAFIGFHITKVSSGKEKYIRGYFVENAYLGGGPGGPYYGAWVPPVLVY